MCGDASFDGSNGLDGRCESLERVVGGIAVGARRGQLQGSVGPNATTDLLIIGSVAALGLVVGTLVGLVRAEGTRQEGADIFARVFADCMMERGYR